jgi:hypothetical protein
MHQLKLDILFNKGSIYYSNTDSIATNFSLDQIKEIMPERIGDKLGQLKFEYAVSKAYFISNKTYALLLKEGTVIKRAKGVSTDSLCYSDFQYMYQQSKPIQGDKTSSEINYSKGSVTIKDSKININ